MRYALCAMRMAPVAGTLLPPCSSRCSASRIAQCASRDSSRVVRAEPSELLLLQRRGEHVAEPRREDLLRERLGVRAEDRRVPAPLLHGVQCGLEGFGGIVMEQHSRLTVA